MQSPFEFHSLVMGRKKPARQAGLKHLVLHALFVGGKIYF